MVGAGWSGGAVTQGLALHHRQGFGQIDGAVLKRTTIGHVAAGGDAGLEHVGLL